MQETTVETRRGQFERWIEEGQHLMALLPGVLEENDRLRGEVVAAEREGESVRRDLEHAKAENHALRDERTEIQDTFSKFMNEIQLLTNDVVQTLSTMQRGSPLAR